MKNIFKRRMHATSDYAEAMLPHNRRGVFFDVLKLHWKEFLLYGLLCFVFCLPMHLVAVAEEMMSSIISLGTESSNATGEISFTIHEIRRISAAVKIPCFMLIAVPIAGFSRVIRQFSWMENVHFKTEFIRGIRENIKQTLGLSVIVGIFNFIAVFACYSAFELEDMILSVFLWLPAVFLLIVILPIGAYMTVSISLYNDNFIGHIKTSLLLYLSAPFKTILAVICGAIVFAVQFLPYYICMFAGRIISSLLIPIIFLGWYLFALNQADKFINEEKFPEYVGKGLFKG